MTSVVKTHPSRSANRPLLPFLIFHINRQSMLFYCSHPLKAIGNMSSSRSLSRKKGAEKLKALRNGSLQDKLGIQFPLATVLAFLKEGKYAERVYVASSVYLTVVLESLAREVLQVAGNTAKDKNKNRILPSHIIEAVRNNEELKQMLSNVTIPSGEVIPRIYRGTLQKKDKEREEKATTT